MKSILFCFTFLVCCVTSAFSQTLAEAKKFYLEGEYAKALPVFETERQAKPADASLNHWYGACLFETGGDLVKAEESLTVASKKKVRDSFYYLGQIYTLRYRFEEAEKAFGSYRSLLKKRGDESAHTRLEEAEKKLSRLRRMVSSTEDIQIIDSVVVAKSEFLDAYLLSPSGGSLKHFNTIFNTNMPVESVVYSNEKGSKIYFAQPGEGKFYQLLSMEKLIDDYGNEKPLSDDNFGLGDGSTNYPFLMPDGVTIYFASKDEESLGGYDLFVSRYNMNNDSYLTPERLNMPFNSRYNDYMMVVDEEKGIGWFASDRFQPEGEVCVYTFIPNRTTKQIENDDIQYKANRALITSIKDSWAEGNNYNNELALARTVPKEVAKTIRDFEFVINDKHTYYKQADFKSKVAKDLYFEVMQMKKGFELLDTELSSLRDAYHNASSVEARRQMTNNILNAEKKQEQLRQEISQLEIRVCNEEIKEIKEAQF